MTPFVHQAVTEIILQPHLQAQSPTAPNTLCELRGGPALRAGITQCQQLLVHPVDADLPVRALHQLLDFG